jgi:DNA-binding winged helix-turn-helix (wHTH) protein/TolB-like protein/Flp pilus assembly protein TadD
MSNEIRELYEFGTFRLDVGERLLTREGQRVPLSEKAFDTLCALVRRGNHLVRKEDLLSEVWPDVIVEENNLDKNISLLRQVLGERTGEGKFIETVRGHGSLFVAEVRTDARATETEPTDVTPTPRFQKPSPKPFISNRRFIAVPIAVVVIGVALVALYFWRRSSVNTTTKIIAVLPFKSLVPEQRDEALELGMADALISKLSEAEEITVRPLSAVRRYDSLDQDSISAGRDLNVEAILDGSLQTLGDRIRVNARLVRVSDGKQLWSSQFNEKFTDIFGVQDSISERVATALRIRLTNKGSRRYTDNLEAYELYMKGRFHGLRLTRAETDKAVAYFQQAIELDRNYALPYLGLAAAYMPMALTSGVPSSQVMPKAKEATLRALEIDPGISEAYEMLGLISFWYEWDWQQAERYCQRALDLDPKNPDAHLAYAHLLSNSGRHERALAEIQVARELDPLSLRINAEEGQIYFFAKDYDKALDRLQKTIDLEPHFWLSHLLISRVYTEKGMHSEAVAEAKKAAELSGNSQSHAYRAYALARWGKLTEARVVLNELLKSATDTYVPPYNIAIAYLAVGEKEKALDYLEKGFAETDVRMAFLKVEPQWDPLRSETRFVALLKRMGIE